MEDNVDISDSELDETEIDYDLKSGKTEQDMVDIFLNKSMSVTEKAEWFDEFVDNWRNSECHFIFSNIRYELEELAYRKSSDDNSDISIDETEKRRILRSIGF